MTNYVCMYKERNKELQSWWVPCERRECIAMVLVSRKMSSCLPALTTLPSYGIPNEMLLLPLTLLNGSLLRCIWQRGNRQRNISFLWHTKRDDAFSAIERESIKVDLVVKKAKTKYMLSKSMDMLLIGSPIKAYISTFDFVSEFAYFG